MPQVSRPLLIALVAVVGLAGVWMTVLRPRAQGGEGAQAAPAGPGAAAPAPRQAPKPVVKAAAPVAKPAAADPTTVLLVAGDGADDVAARSVVRSIRQPGVRTIITSITGLDRYRDVLGDIRIEILPTILVVGSDHTAQQIVGLPDRAQVLQALRGT